MTTYLIPKAVTVDLRAGGETFSETYGPGEAELPAPVADLLVRAGKAERATKKAAPAASKPTSKTKD